MLAAALSKKCCDKGSIHAGEPTSLVAVEIERQLDYIRKDDHDCGGRSRGCNLGAGRRANDDRLRLLKSADSGPPPIPSREPGSGPSYLIVTPHPGRHSAGALTL
jgi:hypothetical protein